MTQVLKDGTNSFLYGNGRISQTGSVTEYFLGDALGSVRQLTDASGEITLAKNYDPYGTVTLSSGNGTSPFAYTDEQQDASGLTYLRARYYSSCDGRFLSRDTWGGDYINPLSLNRWMYVEGNPVNLVDPTGRAPLSLGYIEGRSWGGGVGNGYIEGVEIVYDYATMSRARFTYTGVVGGFLLESWGGTIYTGGVEGFRYDTNKRSTFINSDYSGLSIGGYGDSCIACIPLIGGLQGGGGYFHNRDWSIKGAFLYVSLGFGHLPIDGTGFESNYTMRGSIDYYADKDGYVNRGRLISDILSGSRSPALGIFSSASMLFASARNGQIGLALLAAKRYEDFHVRNPFTCPKPQKPYGPPKPTDTPHPAPTMPPPFPPSPDPFEIPVPWITP
ncbi:MAG: RHS repeat-associated core domain-containing protein [Anaerolineales bacterium]|nr:RHS repeat-associated core domain-containing protein [Anaerolineales bacterium]